MKTHTLSIIAAAGLSIVTGAVHADSITAKTKTKTSYTDVRPDLFIASCVDVIKDYHHRNARLFLDRRGDYDGASDQRSFAIQGWVWKDGERTQATHECVAQRDSKGLVMHVTYANEQQIAENDNNASRTES